MTFDGAWTLSAGWNRSLLVVVLVVLGLSTIASLLSRGLRKWPAIRDSMLLSALIACLSAPMIAIVVTASGASVISVPFDIERTGETSIHENEASASSPGAQTARQAKSRRPATGPSSTRTAGIETRDLRFPPMANDATSSATTAVTSRQQPRITSWMIFAILWMAGSFVLAGFAVRSACRADRIRQSGSGTPRARSIAQIAASVVGLRQYPTILESANVSVPTVIGFRSPAVILPSWSVETLSDEGLRDILVHEFAHIRRRDHWVLVAQVVSRCLYWPIPSIHVLNRELGRSREDVCDNFVLAQRDPITYGELLLQLAARAIGARLPYGTIGMFNRPGELEGRVVRILDDRTSRATCSSLAARVLIISAFLLLATALIGTRFVTAQSPRSMEVVTSVVPAVAQFADPAPTTDSLGDELPAGARLRLGTLRFDPPSGVNDIALSPDGTAVVTTGRQLIVWDAKTGKERWRVDRRETGLDFRGSCYGSRNLAFSSDSSHFFTPGPNDEVFIWDIVSGRNETVAIKTLADGKPSNGEIRSIDVTRDGKKLAVGNANGIVVCDREGKTQFEIANSAKGRLSYEDGDRLKFMGHYSYARFSPDGRLLAVVTSDRPQEIRLLDAESRQEKATCQLAGWLVRMDFSPDGSRIVATERDNAVRLYRVESGEREWSRVIPLNNPYENYTSAVAFSPDGSLVAAGATDHRIYLIDASNGDELGALVGHHWYPWTMDFNADGSVLYSAGWDGVIRRWDVKARKPLDPPEGIHGSEVVAASPDGVTLAFQDDRDVIHLVRSADGREERTLGLPGMRSSQLCFSPDGSQLAAGGSIEDQVQVAVWDVRNGNLIHRWNWPKGKDPHSHVESLSFAPDGSRLAAAVFRQSQAYVWNLVNGREVAQLRHSAVYGLCFSPDGKSLATAGWDSIVRVWDTENWTSRQEHDLKADKNGEGDDRMYTVCYAPSGGLLATAHLDGSVRIWQADGLRIRSRFNIEGRFLYGAMAFSPDGLWLATGGANGAIELRDPLTGQIVEECGRHQFYTYTVGFGRDDRVLLTGGDDGVGYLWDLRPRQLMSLDNVDRLWIDLAGNDSKAAHAAIWALSSSPDRAVELLTQKLQGVKRVVDADLIASDLSEGDRAARRRELLAQAEADSEVETTLTVRRAASLLCQVGTPAATGLLQDLVARDPDGELGRIAAAALKRTGGTP
jgi:WD40 repeat protein/beta-lactamase regulating signal transducer with metallopeptidase domain